MEVSEKQSSFCEIKEKLHKLDYISGLFIFKNFQAKSKKDYIVQLIVPIFITFALTLIISTPIVKKFETESIIITGCILLFVICVFYMIFLIFNNKDIIKTLIDWCENVHDRDKITQNIIKLIIQKELNILKDRTLKIINFLQKLFYCSFISMILFAVFGLLLPDNVYPDYTLPAPLYLPFLRQNTLQSFIITLLVQTIIGLFGNSLMILISSLFICIAFHTLSYMKIIIKIIQYIKNGKIDNKKYENDIRLVLPSTSHVENDKTELNVNEWIKVVVKMITNVNETIVKFGKLFSGLFLFLEIASFGSFFTFGLLLIVLKQHQIFALDVLILPSMFFAMCLINEKILEKFDEISLELYNLPWYEMKIKDKKLLLTAMSCNHMQNGFHAMQIHGLTLERYGIVVKAAYNNCVVLKKLIKKH